MTDRLRAWLTPQEVGNLTGFSASFALSKGTVMKTEWQLVEPRLTVDDWDALLDGLDASPGLNAEQHHALWCKLIAVRDARGETDLVEALTPHPETHPKGAE